MKNSNKNISTAIIKVVLSFNNTVISACDLNGNTLCWATSGLVGFKGSKKSTPYASQVAAENLCQKLAAFKLKKVFIEIRGPGAARESVVRVFSTKDFDVVGIADTTAIAHNGCRLPKRRRV